MAGALVAGGVLGHGAGEVGGAAGAVFLDVGPLVGLGGVGSVDLWDEVDVVVGGSGCGVDVLEGPVVGAGALAVGGAAVG